MAKSCTLCDTPRKTLVRCQIDETGTWHFVCPGACWQSVSGGMDDARGMEVEYPHYRYGGMWKDRSEDGPISAKKPKQVKKRQRAMRTEGGRAHHDADTEDQNDDANAQSD